MTRITTRWLGAALAATLVFSAPPLAAQDKVTLQLNWYPIADHSPFYLGKQNGLFAAEKIDLTIVRGAGSADSAQKIDLKQAEFGISDTPTVLIARSKGAKLKLIGMVFDKGPSNIFFWKDSGIRTPKDLVGKKIAAPPGDSHRLLWPSFAAANGIDPNAVTLVNVKPEGKQAILAAKHVDAVFELYTGMPFMEKALGAGNVGNLLFADHGVSIYAHAYIAHDDLVEKNPDLVRRFLRATYKGWVAAIKDPTAAIDAMAAELPNLDKPAYLANLKLVVDLVDTPRYREHGLGWIEPGQMRKTIEITHAGGKMDRPVTADEIATNAFNSKIMVPR